MSLSFLIGYNDVYLKLKQHILNLKTEHHKKFFVQFENKTLLILLMALITLEKYV